MNRLPLLVITVVTAGVLGTATPLHAEDVLVPKGSVWRYLDDGSDQGSAWTAPAFVDTGWESGAAHLGYGDDDEVTEVDFGPNSNAKYPTTYFRHTFAVTDPSSYDALQLRLVRDDGAVVYLNGTEIIRSNMPGGAITYLTFAPDTVSGSDEDTSTTYDLDPALLVSGDNVLAVEVHQRSASSSDISFDLSLVASDGPWVIRGPYLHLATATSMQVRWRTNAELDGRVWYGTDPGSLNATADDPIVRIGHQVDLLGLLPDTTYYYKVGTSSEVLKGETQPFSFRTAPLIGSRRPVRIWAIGDSGTANIDAAAVRDAYVADAGPSYTDVWLMLGDNAYNEGFDFQYQDAVFEMYPDTLSSTALWPTRGNHDTNATIYYGIFSMPATGQAGGFPSGTEAYYSFDYANVHFVCLDSFASNRAVGGPMWTWLQSDLMATTQDWIVAYWHHPPYSKGSHDSDTEALLMDMRSNFVPLLEDHGVDLVLNGHSHSYERSYLIDGHYGLSTTFVPAMLVDGGDGDPAGDGPYRKDSSAHAGTVYTVAGSSGKLSDMEPVPHPIMIESVELLGSLAIDVDAARLTVRFLTDDGTLHDLYTLEQELDGTWTDVGSALAGTAGVPSLSGSGVLMEGTDMSLELTSARPFAGAWLVFGLSAIDAPFMGGTMVPDLFTPPGNAVPLFTDGTGGITIDATWPAGVPSGFSLWLQYWIDDPAGIAGFAASNGLKAATP